MLGQTSGAQQRQATSFLYSGEQFDTSLQQYHLRARNYNQANGQFTTLDPYSGNLHDPQSLHKYSYCHTDPVNGVDPSGENYSLAQISFSVQWYATSFMIAHPVLTTVISFAVTMLFGELFEGIPPGSPGPFDEMARIRAGMMRVLDSGLAKVESVRCWRAIPKRLYKDINDFFYRLYNVSPGRYNQEYGAIYASRFKSTVRAELEAYAKRGFGFRMVAEDNVSSQISAYGKVLDLTQEDVRKKLGVTLSDLVDPAYGGTSLTKTIGDIAAEMGFDIIIAPSARHSGSNVIILSDKAIKNARYAGKIDL